MASIIHLLPDSVANQIAAGEVVQRPASVLKELVENSIDAGATQVEIILTDAGRTLLEVIDNGRGMSETDARMAFERHATSKIRDAIDLFNLHTMGFRGEALPSIVAVSQVELRTRTADAELGTLLVMAGSEVESQQPVQCPVGTNISVKNLFFNTPARRRFLKSNTTELRNLLTEFHRIVLVNPQVSFTLTSDGQRLYQLPEATTKQRIDAVFSTASKHNFARQLLTVETQTPLVNIRGYVCRPEMAQKTAQQYFFVNGRYMRHPYFHKAVMTAYEGMLAHDVNPHYFIYFDIDPSSIDVNIHPTKTEIHFADEQTIWPLLLAAVKEAIGKFAAVSRIDFDQDDAVQIPVATHEELERVRAPQVSFDPSYNPFANPAGRAHAAASTAQWERLYEGLTDRQRPEAAQSKLFTEQTVHAGVQAAADADGDLFQICRRYILTNSHSGVMLIDQRRAHVRILFDQYMRQLSSQPAATQQLLFPELWQVGVSQQPLMESLLPQLQSLGFMLQPREAGQYEVTGVPAELSESPIAALEDILSAVSEQTDAALDSRQERMAASLAMSAAIRVGQRLSVDEMRRLVERLFACPMHAVDPSGHPVIALVDETQISNLFS